MNITGIEWTHRPGTVGMTWNPIRARNKETGKVGTFCTHASPGCLHCYAEAINRRFGNGLAFNVPNLKKVEFFIDENILAQPLKRKKPATIFVGDMFDLFHEAISDVLILQVLAVIAGSPQHTYQILTKRTERMQTIFAQFKSASEASELIGFGCQDGGDIPDDWMLDEEFECYASNSISGALGSYGVGWPMKNLWLGTSVESQKYADERIPLLLQTPAAVRFLSVEPQLEEVSLRWAKWDDWNVDNSRRLKPGVSVDHLDGARMIDWVICGGESGSGARMFRREWAESLLAQCRAAGTKFFMKQMGSYPVLDPRYDRSISGYSRKLRDSKGGDPTEWPEHLRVREFPQ